MTGNRVVNSLAPRDERLIAKKMFRLLPMQILLAEISAVNGIVSGLFASNYVGVEAMSAVGLFAAVLMLLGAVNTMFVSGSQILCGEQIGMNDSRRMQNTFSTDLLCAAVFAAVMIVILLVVSFFDLMRFLSPDEGLRTVLNQYIIGQAVGILPFMLGQQLSAFLSLENKIYRTTIASIAFIAANVLFNYLFVVVLDLGAFGLALATSLGLWVFFLIQAAYFISGKSMFHFNPAEARLQDAGSIMKIGVPGSLSFGYQTIRRLIVNALILTYAGVAGMSAFAASDAFLGIFWAVQAGMLSVSRMMMSISIGEEDRKSVTDVMRVMFRCMLPLMLALDLAVMFLAVPITHLYFDDVTAPVFNMTVWGFRILPVCMPLAVFFTHFVCYGQATGKTLYVHLASALDGVVFVVLFSAILLPVMGMNGVYTANVINGVLLSLYVLIFAWIYQRHFPRSIEELMMMPDDFGVPDEQRLDLTVVNLDEVTGISEKVQDFCLEQGIDERRSMLSGLCLEEMAGNVVKHGFTLDKRHHTVDVRIVYKKAEKDSVILRIRDDCIGFDPARRMKEMVHADIETGLGIRMVGSLADDINYQSILGMNVLTIYL